MEKSQPPNDITDEEWNLIEERVAHRNVASDEEVRGLFDKYRGADFKPE